MSTGACTVKNYIPGKAGAKGDHHHTYGAVVVQKDGDRFHFRQLNALEDGSFMDVAWEGKGVYNYTPEGVEKVEEGIPLMVCGDLHEKFHCPKSVAATFTGEDSLRAVTQPQAVAWHDVMDGYSCNPHERDNPFMAYARQRSQYQDIKQEIEDCAAFIDKHARDIPQNYVVASNHEDFLSRWMNWADWRKDLPNAEFYLETALAMVRSSKIGANGYEGIHPFPYWMEKFVKKASVDYLGADESLMIRGVEAGFHGHRGPNGARGAIAAFGRIGVRTIIAHAHTPGVRDGVFQVGTLSLLVMDYTSGPSSWMNTNGLVYSNGKRCLVNFIDGHWRKA